ncbi:hypothetical protein ACQ4M4_14490 [Leptolyngbya sp. AN02str]|uniref:hypothetical protein n=1 Tax=Leptolyngbya sp. AN02str TaxID=3423363 RepID=UPI003D323AF3
MVPTVLNELNTSDLDWIVKTGKSVDIAEGTILTQSNRSSDVIFFILDGLFLLGADAQTTFSSQSSQLSSAIASSFIPLIQLTCGEIVGILSSLDSESSSSVIYSQSASTIFAIPRSVLAQKLQEDFAFAARWYRTAGRLLFHRTQCLKQQLANQGAPVARSHQRQAITLFAELEDSDLDWLATVGQVQTLAGNTVLVPCGRSPSALHIVLDGALGMSQPNGAEQLAQSHILLHAFSRVHLAAPANEVRLSRGDLIGDMGLIHAYEPVTQVWAVRESQVLSVPGWRLAAKLLHDVGFASRFYRVLAMLLATDYQAILHTVYTRHLAEQVNRAGVEPSAFGPISNESKLLTRLSLAEARFEWLLQRIQAQ